MSALKVELALVLCLLFIHLNFMISDTQIVIAMFTALLTGILAVRLGVQLYNA